MIGALSIIYDILSDRKEKLKSPYYRILLAIGCVDTSSSFWIGLSTWPIPRGTANGEEFCEHHIFICYRHFIYS